MRRACLLLLPGLFVAWAFAAPAKVYFPTDYRHWAMVKFKFIGPEHPGWTTQGGLRHHYANEAALASWGRFREGSVLVDERVHTALSDQKVWQETGIAHIAVMRKDQRYADTGGWNFNLFAEGDTTVGMTQAQAKARCFDACHQAQQARDYVFSDPRL